MPLSTGIKPSGEENGIDKLKAFQTKNEILFEEQLILFFGFSVVKGKHLLQYISTPPFLIRCSLVHSFSKLEQLLCNIYQSKSTLLCLHQTVTTEILAPTLPPNTETRPAMFILSSHSQ